MEISIYLNLARSRRSRSNFPLLRQPALLFSSPSLSPPALLLPSLPFPIPIPYPSSPHPFPRHTLTPPPPPPPQNPKQQKQFPFLRPPLSLQCFFGMSQKKRGGKGSGKDGGGGKGKSFYCFAFLLLLFSPSVLAKRVVWTVCVWMMEGRKEGRDG